MFACFFGGLFETKVGGRHDKCTIQYRGSTLLAEPFQRKPTMIYVRSMAMDRDDDLEAAVPLVKAAIWPRPVVKALDGAKAVAADATIRTRSATNVFMVYVYVWFKKMILFK
jgi:hypothetical protein